MKSIWSDRAPGLLLCLLVVTGWPTVALDVNPGDVLTRTLRLDGAGGLAPIAPVTPTGLAIVDGDFIVLDFSGPTTAEGLRRKLWRYQPISGRLSLIATTTVAASYLFGGNSVAANDDEAFLLTADGIVAIDLADGSQRDVTAAFGNTPAHVLVAPNGNLVVSDASGITILDTQGTPLSTSTPEGFGAVGGMTVTSAGVVVGVQPNGVNSQSLETNLLSIDPDTGATAIITTLPGIGSRMASGQIAAAADDGFYVAIAGGSEDPRVVKVAPTSFAVTDVPLPDGFRNVIASDLDVDDAGNLLIVGQSDEVAFGTFLLVRIDAATGNGKVALGPGVFGLHYALDDRGGVYLTNNDDRILRLELRTGALNVVSENRAVVGRAGPIVWTADNLYVIDRTLSSSDATLVSVDPVTGEQVALTGLGNKNFLINSYMVRDPASGDLYFTSASLTENNAAAVRRVTPAMGAVDGNVSNGGLLTDARGIVMDATGALLVANRPTGSTGVAGVYRVDPTSGAQTIVSQDAGLAMPDGLSYTEDGRLLLADSNVIWSIDAATGTATAIASDAISGSTAEAENQFTTPSQLIAVTSANVPAAGPLVASILPGSRSVQIGTAATVFATVINAGAGIAQGCSIAPLQSLAANVSYQTTDPLTNALIGAPDTPADIAAGAAQSFVVRIEPTAPIAATTVEFDFSCANTGSAAQFPGVNSLDLFASASPVADVIALSATPSADGIVRIPLASGSAAFAVATSNVGAADTIDVSADTGAASLPLSVFVCETDAFAQCLEAPAASVTTTIDANATPTFSVFVNASDAIAFDAANARVFLRFGAGGNAVGSTSVAVLTE